MVASTAGGSCCCCKPAAAEELTAAPLTFPSLTHRLSLSSPEAQAARLHLQDSLLLHKTGSHPNHSDQRSPPQNVQLQADGRSSVQCAAARGSFTCVWPRAAAPRLGSQLPSTSHTRTLGPGQQLFFTRAAVGAESIIIEERIAVVKISLRCRPSLINRHQRNQP